MCSKRITFYIFITFLFTSNCFLISGSKEIVSPLRIAQCRTRCLQKFSDGQKAKQNDCLQDADCFMCWENCELLQASFHIWGSICKAEICYPGCQEACKFHRDSSQEKQVEPVIKARGEEVLKIENGVARWPRPTSVPVQSPLVYVVMRKNVDSSWTQIIQTADRFVSLPSDTIASNIRVLVVNPDGLVTMYSPPIPIQEKLNDSIVSRIMAGVSSRKTDRISINTPKSNTWELKEVSLIHQKVLVLAEVSWEPRPNRHSDYLVTWEVDGGGLKGNLFTDSTSVTLSLWPDTIYHIQVEVVSKRDKSVPLVLDTHKATQVSFDIPQTSQNPILYNDYKNQKLKMVPELPKIAAEDGLAGKSPDVSVQISQNIDKLIHNPTVARKIFSNDKTKKEVSLEEQFDTPKSNLKSPPRISGSLSSVLVHSADTEAELIDTRQRTELAFGSAAAILLFLIICVLLVLKTRGKSGAGLPGYPGEKSIPDSGPGFQPVVVVSSADVPPPPRTTWSTSNRSTTKDTTTHPTWKTNFVLSCNEQFNQKSNCCEAAGASPVPGSPSLAPQVPATTDSSSLTSSPTPTGTTLDSLTNLVGRASSEVQV